GHGACGEGEGAPREQAQSDDRTVVGEVTHDAEGEKDGGDDRQRDDEAGVEPVFLVALVEHDLQRADADGQQYKADDVEALAGDGGFALVQQGPDDEGGEDANRNVDVEDPRTVEGVGDPATENGPGNGADTGGHAEDTVGETMPPGRVVGQQQALRQRNDGPGDQSLQSAHGDEEHEIRSDAAGERHGSEQQRTDGEQAHFADTLGKPPGGRHGDGIGDGERGDDPGALAGRDAQVAGDGGNGDVG